MIRDPSDGTTKSAPAFPPSQHAEMLPNRETAGAGAGTYSALKAKHGETWGIKQPAPPARSQFKSMSAQQLAEHYAKHDLGFEPKQEAGSTVGNEEGK